MTLLDLMSYARAFVRTHYAALLEGLNLALPATVEDPALGLVVVSIAGPFVVRVLVAADGSAQIAPKSPKRDDG